MIIVLNTLLALTLASAETAQKPLFSESQISGFRDKVKKQGDIPHAAIDMIFNFYTKNRKTVGGLKDTSCIDKKEYKIRDKDPKLTKDILKNGIENETCLCIMDYTVSKTKKRGHCIFLSAESEPKIESFLVAHGSGSQEKDGIPVKFTNALSSTGTTLTGLFLTSNDTYRFGGHAKGVGAYSSTGLTLYGIEDSNWTAANVGKATHGAPYVKSSPAPLVGRSLGCPAMEMDQAKNMLPKCTGKAAWLNFTTALKDQKKLAPTSCK